MLLDQGDQQQTNQVLDKSNSTRRYQAQGEKNITILCLYGQEQWQVRDSPTVPPLSLLRFASVMMINHFLGIGRKLSTKPTSGGPHRMEKRARLKPPMDIPLVGCSYHPKKGDPISNRLRA
jgi:hypothetical protein